MSKQIFTAEQLKAAKAAKSPDELIAMAKEQGIVLTDDQAEKFFAPPIGELSDEELENVAGGGCGDSMDHCPRCQSTDYGKRMGRLKDIQCKYHYVCNSCGYEWLDGPIRA